jgi:hypothetical protein
MQWDLAYPLTQGAQITKVILTIEYNNADTRTMDISSGLYSMEYNAWSPSPTTVFHDLYSGSASTVTIYQGSGYVFTNILQNGHGVWEYENNYNQYVLDDLLHRMQSSIDNDLNYFTLGIRGLQWPPTVWSIDKSNVRLYIEYDPAPSHYVDVNITNVVFGHRDYTYEPDSYVRGDNNVFISGTRIADYFQLPGFEAPPVTKSWLTNHKHLAETWYVLFESGIVPASHFKYWQYNVNNYKVMYYTDYFDGTVTQYDASTATVCNGYEFISTRELDNACSGVKFDFRDPWRTEQNTNFGGPDWVQFSRDEFVEHTAPYRPLDDPQSFGVLGRISIDREPHYAIRYWKYLAYEPLTDSYTKKDALPLEEGDLIYMSQILEGKGIYAVNQNTATNYRTAPDDPLEPYREYQLSFPPGCCNQSKLVSVYKAHLLSNKEAQPTRSANQRKIDIDPEDVYHMVYESAGEVWYTKSSDGQTWSPEELVSDYTHTAANASLAVLDSSVYVSYLQDGTVMLRRRYNGEWMTHSLQPNSSMNNGASTTPVVAAVKTCNIDQGDIVIVLWDNQEHIEYNMLYLYYTDIYNATHLQGQLATNIADNPSFPAITGDRILHFTVAWREGDVIKSAEIDVGGGSCDKDKFKSNFFINHLQNASMQYEVCVYAPSITHDQNSKPVIAYEVKVPSILYSDRWVNIRTYDYTSSSWNTTIYQLPYYQWTQYGDAISPSIGAHNTNTICGNGDIGRGLRVAYHRNWGGGIRVGAFDCNYAEYDQLMNGESFPSVVPYAPNGLLREAYSATVETGPFLHAVRTTNIALAKICVPDMLMVRDLRIGIGDDIAILGISSLSVRHGNNVCDEVGWYEMPDTLVIGVDASAQELIRSEAFTINHGDKFEYETMIYCSDPTVMPSGVSISVQLRRALNDAVLQQFALPIRNFPADTAIWHEWSRDLSALSNETVYISLGIDGTLPGGAIASTAKVWLEGQYMPKSSVGMDRMYPQPANIMLGHNHPNPFSAQTLVPFTLPTSTRIKLAVYDVMGREVASVAEGEFAAGYHELSFMADDLPAGTYVIKLTVGTRAETRTMILTK